MAKGPPAVFPILFLIALAACTSRWKILWDFVRSGAIVSLIMVALPWWLYAMLHDGGATWRHELGDIATGRDHGGALYLPWGYMLASTLPFTPLVLAALAMAVARCRMI